MEDVIELLQIHYNSMEGINSPRAIKLKKDIEVSIKILNSYKAPPVVEAEEVLYIRPAWLPKYVLVEAIALHRISRSRAVDYLSECIKYIEDRPIMYATNTLNHIAANNYRYV